MQSSYIPYFHAGDFHRLHVLEWGRRDNARVVICVHGLTRNGRDFDDLARALCDDFRVLCPDMPGRGASDWLSPASEYGYPAYLNAVSALLAWTRAVDFQWVGTSMGGLIGMLVAACSHSPIRRLILNDVGPQVPVTALKRIAVYLAVEQRFESVAALEQHLRLIHAPFGPLTDEQWAHLASHSARQAADGGWLLHYDPGIAEAFKAEPKEDVDLWPVWAKIRCPVRIMRGERSDLLLAETVSRMASPGTDVDIYEVAGVGHAPALMSEDQIDRIRTWLQA